MDVVKWPSDKVSNSSFNHCLAKRSLTNDEGHWRRCTSLPNGLTVLLAMSTGTLQKRSLRNSLMLAKFKLLIIFIDDITQFSEELVSENLLFIFSI